MKPLFTSFALLALASPCAAQINAIQATDPRAMQLLAARLFEAGRTAHHRAIAPHSTVSISIQTDLVVIRDGDLDTRSINFDTLPLQPTAGEPPMLPENQIILQYAVGYPVTLLHQNLMAKTSLNAILVKTYSASAVTTFNGVPVTITYDEIVSDPSEPSLTPSLPASLPSAKWGMHLQGSLTLTPILDTDKRISLRLSLPPDLASSPKIPAQTFLLRPVAAGSPILLRNFYPNPRTGAFLSTPLNRAWTLLIFVTSTVVSENK